MSTIPHPERGCKYEKRNFDLRLEAQGSLFAVKLSTQPKMQQRRSLRDDFSMSLDNQINARREIARMAENPNDPYQMVLKRIAENPDAHLINLMEQHLNQKKKLKSKSKRGKVTEFSKKSRNRLLRMAAKLDSGLFGLMLTFTYRENMLDGRLAKNHLEKLALWLKRIRPNNTFIWRMEFQERGAIHFHIIALNVAYIDAKKLTAYWQKLTGDDSYPDVQKLRSRKRVMSYISKYIGKVTQSGTIAEDRVTDNGGITEKRLSLEEALEVVALDQRIDDLAQGSIGLDSLPYSDNYTGRYWGVINRKFLPQAPLMALTITDDVGDLYFKLKRYARRKWKFLSRRIQNFYLYTDDPNQWLSLVYSIMLE